MASLTKQLMTKRRQKLNRAGRKRKNKQSKKSTLSHAELFAALGKPEG